MNDNIIDVALRYNHILSLHYTEFCVSCRKPRAVSTEQREWAGQMMI